MKRQPTTQPAIKRKFTALEGFSPEDWDTFITALEEFNILQQQLFQDCILLDLFVETGQICSRYISEQTRRLLLDLIQGKLDPSQIDPEHIYTGYIYCSAISIGLEKISHSGFRFWGQKGYELINTIMSTGGIKKLHNNQKLILMDLLIKEAYTRIKRADFWPATILHNHAKLIANIIDKSTLREEDPDISLQADLPTFLKLHLGTFDIWETKNHTEKISLLKSFLNEAIDRVQVGTLVMTGLLLCCESEEVFSSLMKASCVPIQPQYREAVIAYFTKISQNISLGTADQKLIFYLSLAILRSRDAGSLFYHELEYAWNFLRQVQNPDSNTCWLCGIGVSLSVMCGSQLSIGFQMELKNINPNYFEEWNKKYQLDDKILALTLDSSTIENRDLF
jgi:hypothetical protein